MINESQNSFSPSSSLTAMNSGEGEGIFQIYSPPRLPAVHVGVSGDSTIIYSTVQ